MTCYVVNTVDFKVRNFNSLPQTFPLPRYIHNFTATGIVLDWSGSRILATLLIKRVYKCTVQRS